MWHGCFCEPLPTWKSWPSGNCAEATPTVLKPGLGQAPCFKTAQTPLVLNKLPLVLLLRAKSNRVQLLQHVPTPAWSNESQKQSTQRILIRIYLSSNQQSGQKAFILSYILKRMVLQSPLPAGWLGFTRNDPEITAARHPDIRRNSGQQGVPPLAHIVWKMRKRVGS